MTFPRGKTASYGITVTNYCQEFSQIPGNISIREFYLGPSWLTYAERNISDSSFPHPLGCHSFLAFAFVYSHLSIRISGEEKSKQRSQPVPLCALLLLLSCICAVLWHLLTTHVFRMTLYKVQDVPLCPKNINNCISLIIINGRHYVNDNFFTAK